jgi:hypothetical protein
MYDLSRLPLNPQDAGTASLRRAGNAKNKVGLAPHLSIFALGRSLTHPEPTRPRKISSKTCSSAYSVRAPHPHPLELQPVQRFAWCILPGHRSMTRSLLEFTRLGKDFAKFCKNCQAFLSGFDGLFVPAVQAAHPGWALSVTSGPGARSRPT